MLQRLPLGSSGSGIGDDVLLTLCASVSSVASKRLLSTPMKSSISLFSSLVAFLPAICALRRLLAADKRGVGLVDTSPLGSSSRSVLLSILSSSPVFVLSIALSTLSPEVIFSVSAFSSAAFFSTACMLASSAAFSSASFNASSAAIFSAIACLLASSAAFSSAICFSALVVSSLMCATFSSGATLFSADSSSAISPFSTAFFVTSSDDVSSAAFFSTASPIDGSTSP
mmetsp:Transcript_84871/g.134083  ORF Transcript_84871/g.134083 Transcript_84871/m.134083 type:complete len:228 (-) Transcript_84871:60-743(-)